jgi:tRNA nucleotidyltransferase (CCA-adding enzyme)
MREWAPQIAHVSGERIGGGLATDGMGELSKLLLGDHPAKALRLARDTGVLTELVPEYALAIGFDQESRYHGHPLDEHHFEAVQAAADAGASLAVRLALLLHDLGKPLAAWRGDDGRVHYYANPKLGKRAHEELGAEIASTVLSRLRYPTEMRRRVRSIVQAHGFAPPKRDDPVRARRFLNRYGWNLADDILDHKEADLRAKGRDVSRDLETLARFRRLVEEQRGEPHQLRDLAVDGTDLLALGFSEGQKLGQTLEQLLDEVLEAPERNTRDWLLERAKELD